MTVAARRRVAACLGIVLAFGVTAGACSPTPPADPRVELAPIPDTPATLGVEVGSGQTEFVPLTDGDLVDVIYGSQGGYHLWTSVRLSDPTIQEGTINVSARFEAGGAPAGLPSGWAAMPSLVDGAREQLGMRNAIDQPSAVVGKRIILRAEVVTRDGRHGSGEHVVVPRSN